MVTRCDLGHGLDLEVLAESLSGSYEPQIHPAFFYRVLNPRITFELFASGKMLGYGGRTISEVKRSLEGLVGLLEGQGMVVGKLKAPEVRMLVASAQVADSLDLQALAKRFPKTVCEPDQFPGVVWHFEKGAVALVFSTDKIVITGPRSIERLNQIYAELASAIRETLSAK
jgi:transcription initiation factor TFIID TATA-box-binding protein